MTKSIAIVQARLNSTRLPGKILLNLAGLPVLKWVLDRVSRANTLNEVVVATSLSDVDDRIFSICKQWRVECFRGSEEDVLGRFWAAAEKYQPDVIVRINADNPLVDPFYIDWLLSKIETSDGDYLSFKTANDKPVMLTAISFFTEAFTRLCLERANNLIKTPFLREHVTLGIYSAPKTFRVKFYDVPDFCNDANLRFTLDTKEDLELLEEILVSYGKNACNASAQALVEFVRARPVWYDKMMEMNSINPKTDKKQEKHYERK